MRAWAETLARRDGGMMRIALKERAGEMARQKRGLAYQNRIAKV